MSSNAQKVSTQQQEMQEILQKRNRQTKNLPQICKENCKIEKVRLKNNACYFMAIFARNSTFRAGFLEGRRIAAALHARHAQPMLTAGAWNDTQRNRLKCPANAPQTAP